MKKSWPLVLLILTVTGLALGVFFDWLHLGPWKELMLAGATTVTLSALALEIFLSFRKGEIGLDIIAALSMSTALWFGEYYAGAIVAVMYAGGQFLESYAQRRAESGMTQLLSHVPRLAVKVVGASLLNVLIEDIRPGDRLLIRNGDVVPVDGRINVGRAVLNEAQLTGEPLPVCRNPGEPIMSGTSNVGNAFEITASRSAAESTYAGIIRLVGQARASKAPLSRLADRYAFAFLAATLAIAGLAAYLSGEPQRVVAVLVVATPCPLILAVPVALVAGMSKAAANGLLIKGADILEILASAKVVVLDKTGTLTTAEPSLARIDARADPDELLRLAASLEQISSHTIAQAIVKEARRRGLPLSNPTMVCEVPGEGIEGRVGGKAVVLGGRSFVSMTTRHAPSHPDTNGAAIAYVAVDGEMAGTLMFEDAVRDDAKPAIAGLRQAGIKRICLATGDTIEVGRAVAQSLGLDSVKAELRPSEKVAFVKEQLKYGGVLMVGDGVNDAPALAAASAGVAVGRGNLAAAAEAADVVLLRDDLRLIPRSLVIARQSRAIALQSVFAGMGLSIVAMIAAGFGYLAPVQGALLQEVIDIAVILNALRAL